MTGLTPSEERLGIEQGKIACIKAHRSRTNYGLKESKDAVEAYFLRKGLNFGPLPGHGWNSITGRYE
jgi:hypothetical protein